MASVVLNKVVKRFGVVEAVRDIDLDIADGEFVVLVGPSGCGKTTTLRMIAGLEPVTSGAIHFNDQRVNDLPPKDRDIAMVFQSYALYPHMSVFSNMAFGLKLKRSSREEIDSRVKEAAALLNITELLNRKPRELSGGQRQRVAMGRAIVRQPRVFLFDEPLSNLDANLRAQMRVEIKRLHAKLDTTVVYVTHDQIEAMTLADRIVVMRDGIIEQEGDPMSLYREPVNKFVAGFIGAPKMNFISGRLEQMNGSLSLVISPEISLTVPTLRKSAYERFIGHEIEFGIRAEHLLVGEQPGFQNGVVLDIEIEVVEPTGGEVLVFTTIAGTEIVAKADPNHNVKRGDRVALTVDMNHMHLIDPASETVVNPASAGITSGYSATRSR
ncbi:MAG: sn-glycerol-3-phosphate ABC transporter ATP-binding protein UgpC [Pseudomonadota bacterium]|nr:sn-glycerol-3-phosphate ABC transporter ATP-binding protein UgpC [Pseudomonadota bacterium]